MYRVIVSVALAVGAMSGPAAFAQTEDAIPAPAEVPPASYDDASYVDSRGCAYARAAVNGAVTWVPQLGADRKPLCGLAPSLPLPPKTEVMEPEPLTVDPAEVAVAAPVAQPEPAAEPPAAPEAKPVAAQSAPKASAPRQTKALARQKFTAPRVVIQVPATAIVKRHGLWRQIEIPGKALNVKAIASGVYVQVGAYGRTANADVAISKLRAAGLPAASTTAHKGGAPLYLVLTGPFPDAPAAQDGLRRARAAGFADAFIY
jgi:cell division septation protein DedD